MNTPTLTKCPDWCTLESGHDWDTDQPDGTKSRGHGGPRFGKYVGVEAYEYSDVPGRLLHIATVSAADGDLDGDDLIELAMGAVQAAAWLRDRTGVDARTA